MKCQSCTSSRVAYISGKCSDRSSFVDHRGNEKDGYVPYELNLDGGDYIEFKFCLNCGTIQGQWPISDETLDEIFNGDKE